MFLKRLLIISFFIGGTGSFTETGVISSSYACDKCAAKIIREGFSQMNAASQKVSTALGKLNEKVGELTNEVDESNKEIQESIADYTTTMENTLTESNDRVVEALSGLFVQISSQFSILNDANTKHFLELQNDIIGQFSATEKLLRERAATFEAGGALGNFNEGEIANSLLLLYTGNSDYSKAVYALNSQFVTRWNLRDAELFQSGKSSLFKSLSNRVLKRGDQLIQALNTQSIISKEDYQDLVYFAAFAINPGRVEVTSESYLPIVAKQAALLRQTIAKAPIIPLSEENFSHLGEFTPTFVEPDGCPSLLIEQGLIKQGVRCTSLDAILASLIERPGHESYVRNAAKASKRALTEEMLRSQVVANIIQKRILDSERANNVLTSF